MPRSSATPPHGLAKMKPGSQGANDQVTADPKQWTLSRLDVRSPIAPVAWPVARVELIHPVRGKVTDLASAPGIIDAAFAAAGQIVGITPKVANYDVHSARTTADGSLIVSVQIELELHGRHYHGSHTGVDLIHSTLSAWLEAACLALGGRSEPDQRLGVPT